MTGWADGPLAAYDCETTGVNVETDRIVTACAAIVNDGPARTSTWLADPGIDIPDAAIAIHGITTAHARQHGQPAADVAAEIEATLATAWAAGPPVVGFNITYDLTLLDRELRRHHGRPLAVDGPVIDPLVIDRRYDPYRRGPRRLDAMCAHYRVTLANGGHNAEADAVAAARLAWKQARAFPELAAMTPAELTTEQAGWHRAWAEEFTRYLQAQGRTDDLPDGAWPLRPFIPGSLDASGR